MEFQIKDIILLATLVGPFLLFFAMLLYLAYSSVRDRNRRRLMEDLPRLRRDGVNLVRR